MGNEDGDFGDEDGINGDEDVNFGDEDGIIGDEVGIIGDKDGIFVSPDGIILPQYSNFSGKDTKAFLSAFLLLFMILIINNLFLNDSEFNANIFLFGEEFKGFETSFPAHT